MKTYLKNIIGLLGCALIISCNDYLDVQPEDKYLEEDVFSREVGIQTVLNGIYMNMANKSTYGGNLTMSTVEILGQHFDLSEIDHSWQEFGNYNYEDLEVQNNLDLIWTSTYTNLFNTNNFITGLDTYDDVLSKEKKNLLKGEAIALRAMFHFDLLRLFGPVYNAFPEAQAIPYYKDASATLTPILSATQVMTLILGDLEEAAQLLTNDPVIEHGKIAILEEDDEDYSFQGPDFYRYRNLRLNYFAVKALQARAHLYAGNNTAALTAAKSVIEDASVWFPWTPPADIIGSSPDRIFSSEVLFAIQNSSINNRHKDYYVDDLNKKSILAPNTSQLEENTFESNQNDYRLNSTWILPSTGIKNFRTFYKYANIDADEQYMQPLIKMSEMYYIVAETETDPSIAIQYLNTARNNRGLTDLPLGVDIKNEIYKEYRREFYGEGQLFFYYKRNNFSSIPNGSTSNGMLPMNSAKYVVPLPLSETDYR